MKAVRHVIRPVLTSLLSIWTFAVPATGATAGPPIHDSLERWSPGWILVRLDLPLDGPRDDDSFALETGRVELDAAIRQKGILRIGYALPVSSRAPADPAAFRRFGLDRTYRFFVPAGSDVQDLAQRFEGIPGVIYAEPDPLGSDPGIPTDTLFDQQWHFHQASDADIDAPEAWDISTGVSGVVVAIVDSGIDMDHEDLDGILWVNPGETAANGIDDDANGYIDDVHGWNFETGTGNVDDTTGHGTGVSSVAVAESNNDQGISGTCWNCRIMSVVKASGAHSDYADAAIWAADRGAQVVNGSYGTLGGSSTLRSAVGYIADQGVIHVSSSHNLSSRGVYFPARYRETLAVGATTVDDSRAGFSNYGPRLDVVAPGEDLLAAEMGGGYAPVSGTSYSAPLVSGLTGLVFSTYPSPGLDGVRHLIRAGADDEVGAVGEDTSGFDEYHGWGRVNAHRTLQAAQSSVSLRVEGGSSTRLSLATPNPLADSYDFARGDLAALREEGYGVSTGTLTCIENDSADADTAGNEDTDVPVPGEGFFYVARFNAAPGSGSYGGSSRNRDRFVFDQPPYWSHESDVADTLFGNAVYGAGDVNGDGYDDLLVGARLYDGDLPNEGAAFVFHGSPSGFGSAADWTVEGDQTDSRFGMFAAGAGDVNNDGYDDVVVGAPRHDNGETDEGAAFLYLGSAGGLANSPAWSAESNQAGAEFGFKIRPAGDVNGDGYDDVVVGARYYDGTSGDPSTHVDRGRAFLYLGSSSGLDAAPAWEAEIEQASASFGIGVGRGGDVNGDGYDDVVVGASLYDNGEIDEGLVHVYHGSPSGPSPSASPDTVLEMNVADARFGTITSVVGDVNCDGYDDLLVGAWNNSSGGDPVGKVYLFTGSSAGVSTTPSWSFEGDQPETRLGINVEAAGDVNGDSCADFLVGADFYDVRRSDEGRAYLFLGSPGGPAAEPDWTVSSRQPHGGMGWALSGIGDIDGDGVNDEIALGVQRYSGDETWEGKVVVYRWPLEDVADLDCPEN